MLRNLGISFLGNGGEILDKEKMSKVYGRNYRRDPFSTRVVHISYDGAIKIRELSILRSPTIYGKDRGSFQSNQNGRRFGVLISC